MRRIISAFALLTIIIISTTSCKKNSTAAPIATFQPISVGSVWNYTAKNYVAATTVNYVLTSTSKDTLINSRGYHINSNSIGGNEYYNLSGADYFQYGTVATFNQKLELNYLKDAAVGTTWTETENLTINSIPLSIPLTYNISEKLSTFTIPASSPAITYNDVVHVKITMGAISAVGQSITPVSSLDYYYARGIGRIYSRTKVAIVYALAGININTDDELKLNSATIL